MAPTVQARRSQRALPSRRRLRRSGETQGQPQDRPAVHVVVLVMQRAIRRQLQPATHLPVSKKRQGSIGRAGLAGCRQAMPDGVL